MEDALEMFDLDRHEDRSARFHLEVFGYRIKSDPQIQMGETTW